MNITESVPGGLKAMYKYEYETVSCDFGGWGFGSGNIYGIGDYQSIINRRAEDGWRYFSLSVAITAGRQNEACLS